MHEKFNAPSLQLFANGAVCDSAVASKKMLCDEKILKAVRYRFDEDILHLSNILENASGERFGQF